MQFPCETIVRDVLPAFKAFIVKELFNNHNFSQNKIATLLGITQASVSYYLHGERGKTGLELIKKHDQVRQVLLNLTKTIVDATEPLEPDFFTEKICVLCSQMHKEFGCKASHK